MIKLGICTSIENAASLAAAGFDYVELSLTNVAAMPEEDFQSLLKAKLPCQALNCMVPADLPVTGPHVDRQALSAYLEAAYARAQALGAQTVVFGSGGARQVPKGFAYKQAWQQLRGFLEMVGSSAARHRLTIAVEPLRRQECNLLNTVAEAVCLTSLAGLPGIGVLGDTYHMAAMSEPLEALAQAGPLLCHVHMAEPHQRRYPLPGDGQDYSALFKTLRSMGYQGRVSIEGSSPDPIQEGAAAFSLLDSLRRG